MLTPDPVLTNNFSGCGRLLCLLVSAVAIAFFGCAPSGPRALVEGKNLLDAGDQAGAISKLSMAVEAMPANAQAWNYLGLAYHLAGRPEDAEKRYRFALERDRNLATVRFNLGCLYLERDNLPAALNELHSYTLLQPSVVEGWLKLGQAQFGARRFDDAERSLRAALELQPRHSEALNGLGLILLQRRRTQEAFNHFHAAAVQEPPYAPAVLNAAILNHQVGNRPAAIQRYRQYLALGGAGTNAPAVEQLVRQLETEAHGITGASRPQTPLAGNSVPKTSNTTATATAAAPKPSSSGVAAAAAPARSNSPAAPVPATPVSVSAQISAPKPAPEPPRQVVRSNPPKGAEVLAAKPAEPEVSAVHPGTILKPAQELSKPAVRESVVPEPAVAEGAGTNSQRRGFLSRLNPFGGRNRTNAAAISRTATTPGTRTAGYSGRYSFLSPAAPTAGDLAESERAFKRGVKAQRAGSLSLAITEYQAAAKADPANYDAYYNLGLAALERNDARLSLWAYEIALALKPDAEDARYNFALALKAGGYWEDAADQLDRLLVAHPTDARAHLSLGNLLAQQLQQPEQAKPHYARVLELNPKHPEAAKIRYWLTANQ